MPTKDIRAALKTARAALAEMEAANERAKTEGVQDALCEAVEALGVCVHELEEQLEDASL